MTWQIEKSDTFNKWWKKESVDENNYAGHERSLQEFQNIPLPHNVQSCIFKNKSFQCWVTRLPDRARKQGKSGGFRVVVVLDLEDKVLHLQGIFRRDHLKFEGCGGKYQSQYDELLGELAKAFVARE